MRAKLLFTICALAVICTTNVATAQDHGRGQRPAAPATGPMGFHPPSDADKEKARLKMGITREQQAQIEAMFRDTDAKRREIGEKMRTVHEQLYKVYDSYDYDRNQAKALHKQLNNLRRQFSDLYSDNEDKLRKIMNRDQFTRMRAMMKEQRDQWHGGGDKGQPRR